LKIKSGIDNTSEGGAIINNPSRLEHVQKFSNGVSKSIMNRRRNKKNSKKNTNSNIHISNESQRASVLGLLRKKSDSILDNKNESLLDENYNDSGCNSARPKTTYTWRIWLMDGDLDYLKTTGNPEDPLISPWKWSGTMKFLHLNCLKGWLDSKRQKRETPKVNSYFWK